MATNALAYETTNALRSAASPGFADGDVAYAYGNKYVWDNNSTLADNGGDGSGPTIQGGYALRPYDFDDTMVYPSGRTDGRWISQGKLLQLRDFAPGLTTGTTDVSDHLNELFKYQGFLYLCEPFEKYLLTNTVQIPNGGGIIGVFPTAGASGVTQATDPSDTSRAIPPGAPQFLLNDPNNNNARLSTGFTAEVWDHNDDPGNPAWLIPENYRGIRLQNFAIVGGQVQIDTGFSQGCHFENLQLLNFSKTGIIMVNSERNTFRNVWCTLSSQATADTGFAFAYWEDSEWKSGIDSWAGRDTQITDKVVLETENIWVHRTEMSSCGTMGLKDTEGNFGTFTNSIKFGNHNAPNGGEIIIFFNIWRYLAFGHYTGTVFDGGSDSFDVPKYQMRDCSFEHILPDGIFDGGSTASLFSFDSLLDCTFRQIRDQNLDSTANFLTANLMRRVVFEACLFEDHPIKFDEAENAVEFRACRGKLDVTTPSIPATTFEGDFLISDQEIVGDVDISGPFSVTGNSSFDGNVVVESGGMLTVNGASAVTGALTVSGLTTAAGALDVVGNTSVTGDLTVNGTADIEDTALEILYSLGGTNAVGANLDYVEQSRLSLEAGFRKTATMPSSGPLSLDLCTLTAISGTAAGRITVSAFKANQTAINEVNFKGITTQSAITAVQNYDNGGASGGCSIDSISTSTTSGVHTISATVSGFTADEDVIFYVDVHIQGLKPDITVL